MSEPTDLKDEIAAAGQGLASASGDGFSARAVPVKDIIAADNHLAAKDALHTRGKKTLGVRFAKLQPPGSV